MSLIPIRNSGSTKVPGQVCDLFNNLLPGCRRPGEKIPSEAEHIPDTIDAVRRPRAAGQGGPEQMR